MTRVVIVDDQAVVRAGFRAILGAEADLDVVGEAGDGASALALLDAVACDVVLMDIRMPRMDGLEATRRLRGAGTSGPRVLVLTTFDLDEYVFAALRAGASGFLLKDAEPSAVIDAVRVIAAGESLLAPAVTGRLIEAFLRAAPPEPAERSAATARLARLSPREVEVLALMARGRSNSEVAAELVVSDSTVKTHVNAIFSKLDVRDRVQATILAYETGVVRLGQR